MIRKFKKLPLLENISIIDAGSEGKAVGKSDELIVFIEGGIPGDVVDVQLTKKKKNYAEGRIVKIHQSSEKRSQPFCEHFSVCGGCKWQNLEYKWQLYYKQKQVADNLKRIGKIDLPEITPILASSRQQQYRNKLEYTFSNKMWLTLEEIQSGKPVEQRNALGFHIPGMFDKVLDIRNCYLQAEPSNSIRLAVKAYALDHGLSFYDIREHKGLLRNLIIRTSSTGELMLIFCFGELDQTNSSQLMDHILNLFPGITSLMYTVNLKMNDTIADQEIITYKKQGHFFEEMEGLKFKISPKSFYQTNSQQAHELYKVVREYAGLTGKELVYDLYTGTGTIANFIAAHAKKVIGVEYIADAIEDAKFNSTLNGIKNTSFFAGDMKVMLSDSFIETNGRPDVIITDPPRNGMDEAVARKIAALNAERIVYVSCNPATQARDLLILGENYEVTRIQPLDMFPHTHHVENVVLLKRFNAPSPA